MKNRLIEILLEALLLFVILEHHQFDHLPTIILAILKFLFLLIFLYTLYRVFIDQLNLSLFFINLAILSIFYILFGDSEELFNSGKFIEILWQGYCRIKWGIVLMATIARYTHFKEKGLEATIQTITRNLLIKVHNARES